MQVKILTHSLSSINCGLKGLSLRISVTENCQLKCQYCMPFKNQIQKAPYLDHDEIVRVVRSLQKHYTIKKLHITGGDPLMRSDLAEIIEKVSNKGISDIALTTNAQKLKGLAEPLKNAGLKRVNISLDSLNENRFHSISKMGKLHKTLEGIDAAIEQGLSPIKLNTVVIRGVNDDEITDIAEYGLTKGCHVRFLELMPIGPAIQDFKRQYVSSDEIRSSLEKDYALSPLPSSCNSSSVDFKISNSSGLTGLIGLISPYSKPFCHGCNRLRLTSDGRFVGCLKNGNSVNIRPFIQSTSLSSDHEIVNAAAIVLSQKQHIKKSSISSSFTSREMMSSIGG